MTLLHILNVFLILILAVIFEEISSSELGGGGSRGALLNVIVAPLKRGLFVLLLYAGMPTCARAHLCKVCCANCML